MDKPKPQYGIPTVKRASKLKPKTGISAGGVNAKTVAAAKKVIAEHQAVIKALAKR
jgi:saccharopine dehydrogenase-like NADP-dependent oxidoreductase